MNKPLAANPGHVQYLCARLEIGTRRGELVRVYGGFHHKMWRLETDCGSYAIKQLAADSGISPAQMADHFNITETVAETLAGHGIPALFALKCGADYLQLIDNAGYLVYPWTDAVAIDIEDICAHHALEIARVMAGIHRADIAVPGVVDVQFDIHLEEKIIELVQAASELNTRGATALVQYLPTFLGIAERQREAIPILEKHEVISHGDLDHKNVLWNAGDKPILIDWESVRKLNPGYETLMEALDWSGITTHFNQGLFEEFILGYKKAGGVIEGQSIPAAFDCILGDWLNWLMYNVGRSMDLEDGEQRIIGAAQVDLALSTILRIGSLMPQLMSIASGGTLTAGKAI